MRHFLNTSYLACICLTLLGCITQDSSRESRIRRSLAIFESYPEDIQQSLRNGEVQVGFDEDMVYFAMGSPHFITKKQDGAETIRLWQYFRNTRQQKVTHEYVPGNRQTDQYDTFDWDVVVKSEKDQQFLMKVEFSEGKVVAVTKVP